MPKSPLFWMQISRPSPLSSSTATSLYILPWMSFPVTRTFSCQSSVIRIVSLATDAGSLSTVLAFRSLMVMILPASSVMLLFPKGAATLFGVFQSSSIQDVATLPSSSAATRNFIYFIFFITLLFLEFVCDVQHSVSAVGIELHRVLRELVCSVACSSVGLHGVVASALLISSRHDVRVVQDVRHAEVD